MATSIVAIDMAERHCASRARHIDQAGERLVEVEDQVDGGRNGHAAHQERRINQPVAGEVSPKTRRSYEPEAISMIAAEETVSCGRHDQQPAAAAACPSSRSDALGELANENHPTARAAGCVVELEQHRAERLALVTLGRWKIG